MIVEVFGNDLGPTVALEAVLAEALAGLGLTGQAAVRKIEDPAAMIARGIRRVPGLMVDGKVVSRGRVPSVKEMRGFLEAAARSAGGA